MCTHSHQRARAEPWKLTEPRLRKAVSARGARTDRATCVCALSHARRRVILHPAMHAWKTAYTATHEI